MPGFAAAFPSGAAAQLLKTSSISFWLAILAVVLGVGSYLAVHFFPKGWLPDPDKPVPLKVNHQDAQAEARFTDEWTEDMIPVFDLNQVHVAWFQIKGAGFVLYGFMIYLLGPGRSACRVHAEAKRLGGA